MDRIDTPLRDLRVLDCTTMISGNFATVMFADFGAEVISIEHPRQPDPIRAWPPHYEGESLWWKSLGRNKRSATLDLSTEAGQELLLEMAETADVLIENFRPGTMEKWGLGYDALSDANEELVMVRISGYGQDGPDSQKPGFGSIAEGLSGWAHSNGFPDSEPLLPPIPLADLTAGQFAVQATMFALFERELSSGKGQVIDVSLYEPLFRLFIGEMEAYDTLGKLAERTGNRSMNSAPRNVYETADGHIALSASAQRIFENVMEAIGKPELVDDSRFETNAKRIEHADQLDAEIEAWTKQRPTAEAVATMQASDAIVGPIYSMADIAEDEQYQARGNLIEVDDPDIGRVTTVDTVPRMSRTDGRVEHLGSGHGADNEGVYVETFGVDPGRYEELKTDGVI